MDAALARIAGRQHGVLTLAQLLAAGLSRKTVTRRAAAGRLHRIYHAVYALGHRGLSREGRWLAAVFAAGAGAGLSHVPAAALWETRRIRTDFVDVVAPKRRAPSGPLRVHASRTLVPEDVTRHRGIPVTTVARTLVDLTDVLTAHQIANVIHEAAFRNRFDEVATRAAMGRARGRAIGVLEKALALHAAGSPGTRSELEDAFLALMGEPEPLVNMRLLGEEVDFHWPERRLVVEIDGSGHERPRAQRRDARIERRLADAGYTVVRFTGDEVERTPDVVRERVASVGRV